jgi:hypothetical protein
LRWLQLIEKKAKFFDVRGLMPGRSRQQRQIFFEIAPMELDARSDVDPAVPTQMEATMTFGKGALLWLIGIPLPIILLLALFWR